MLNRFPYRSHSWQRPNAARFYTLLMLLLAVFVGCSSDTELMADNEVLDLPTEGSDIGSGTGGEGLVPTSDRELILDPNDEPAGSLVDSFPEFFPEGVRHSIPLKEIRHGGPPKDGIPALTRPEVLIASEANYLKDTDVVLGLSLSDVARAYPIGIMNWHEIVNDSIGSVSVAITFCPLCGTGIAFRADVGGRVLEFGVSGLLYNSDLLMYDRGTDKPNLWAQALGEAVVGPNTGAQLEILPMTQTTWGEWRRTHPLTTVLSTNTGHNRNYARDPYAGYELSAGLFFPVGQEDGRLHPKALVLGVRMNGVSKAYPIKSLQEKQVLNDSVGGESIVLVTSPDSEAVRVYLSKGQRFEGTSDNILSADKGEQWKMLEDILTNPRTGEELKRHGEVFVSFWFGWFTFYPDTLLYP